MEKEGLKRCLDLLESNGLTVDYIVTDHHPQIQNYLRDLENYLVYLSPYLVKRKI